MSRRLKLILIALIIAIVYTTGCSVPEESGGGPSSLDVQLATLAALEKQASHIIEARIIDNVDTIEHGGVPFTVSEALVLVSLKGDFEENATVRIVETGGMMRDGQEFKFNGVPVVKRDEHLYLFVEPYVGPFTEEAYVPIGVYEGKFIVTDGQVEQAVGQEPHRDRIEPIAQEDFLALIEQTLTPPTPANRG